MILIFKNKNYIILNLIKISFIILLDLKLKTKYILTLINQLLLISMYTRFKLLILVFPTNEIWPPFIFINE